MAHEHIVYMMLVDSAAIDRDQDSLERFTPILEELAIRDNHLPYLAVAHRAWGVLHRLTGDYHKADKRYKQSLEIFNTLEMHWQIGRTLTEIAELDLEAENLESATQNFKQAAKAFEDIGAKADLARIQAIVEKLDIP